MRWNAIIQFSIIISSFGGKRKCNLIEGVLDVSKNILLTLQNKEEKSEYIYDKLVLRSFLIGHLTANLSCLLYIYRGRIWNFDRRHDFQNVFHVDNGLQLLLPIRVLSKDTSVDWLP